ncbi:hypothetical protein H8B02_44585 [Bradyrhizobium sp. Pear77]|uniref:hypothetical protein n=1 Tax=Bradyrhizobium altum TaxID=1571202 RepID=UPI001E38C42D|nr:hypothetical protein [Bradyrhizobium altum]MCC8960237.1 hypothetical protein [Bradyrhizobium altum]
MADSAAAIAMALNVVVLNILATWEILVVIVTFPRFTSHTINSLTPDKGMARPVFKYPDLIGCDLFERGASNIRVTGDAMRGPQWRPARATRQRREGQRASWWSQARTWAEPGFTAGWFVTCSEHAGYALQSARGWNCACNRASMRRTSK